MRLLSWICLLTTLLLSVPKNGFTNDLFTGGIAKKENGTQRFYATGPGSANKKSYKDTKLTSFRFNAVSLTVSKSSLSAIIDGFTVVLDKKNVVINWVIASELNLNKFIIERSADGKNYKDVALIYADDSYSSRNYTYKDKDVSSSTKVLYYRLRCVDNTEEVTYSLTRVVRLRDVNEDLSSSIVVYPNPSPDEVKITFPDAWQGKEVLIELYNNSGIKIQELQIKNASQTETMQIHRLPAGFYLISAVCEGKIASKGIFKE